MEEWKKLVYIGAILIILAIMFAILRKEFNIWIIMIIIVAALDIAVGLYRKKLGR
ncbi:hypothetical protein [Methanobrevibacter sp. YE315]|uniref:hypothetical protein n=1 Tax=Methanobrevibacter sp. YE315 TaxID=1609968 RepID=UPI000A76B08E|nr:hypothetical protein [Methanobrevibacter sp. YE315]